MGVIIGRTREVTMHRIKIAVSIDSRLLEELDQHIARGKFPSRSRAIEAALAEKLQHLARTQFAREVRKLDAEEEKALAEEGVGSELAGWPAY